MDSAGFLSSGRRGSLPSFPRRRESSPFGLARFGAAFFAFGSGAAFAAFSGFSR
jgi:hypothetical protein